MMYGVAKHGTHLMLETYCKNIDLEFVWMQFSNIYGPNNKTGNLVSYTISELSRGNEATFGPSLQPYDFIYIDDLIDAILRIGENKTHKNCYFIGSGTPRILKDYLLDIGRMCGRKELIKIGARLDDGIKYDFNMFLINDLVEDIGDYNSTPFEKGIQSTIEAYI
jgi:nucleoside-diphosphate-sugar epimerase